MIYIIFLLVDMGHVPADFPTGTICWSHL